MATRGAKTKPAELKLVTGNPGHRPIDTEPKIEIRETPLVSHKPLTPDQQTLWGRFIDTAWWLTDHDVPKAYIWVCLQTEYDDAPGEMSAAMIAQLRVLGSELGLDAAARAKIGANGGKKKDAADQFFT